LLAQPDVADHDQNRQHQNGYGYRTVALTLTWRTCSRRRCCGRINFW
jgi:hypothetical protein